MRRKKSRSSFLSAVGVISIASIAIWQFYVFVTFKDPAGALDIQGGRQHLWWAIGLGLIACIASFLFFSVFLQHDRSDELHVTSQPSRGRPS